MSGHRATYDVGEGERAVGRDLVVADAGGGPGGGPIADNDR